MPVIAASRRPTTRPTTGFNGGPASMPVIVLDPLTIAAVRWEASTGDRHRWLSSRIFCSLESRREWGFNGGPASMPVIGEWPCLQCERGTELQRGTGIDAGHRVW